MKVILVLIAAVALGVGGWFYWQKRAGTPASSQSPGGRPGSAVIETRSIHFAVTAAGDIGPAEQVSVRPEVNGRIDALPVDVGDQVKKGDLLFKLNDSDLQTEREGEVKSVERTRLELGQAQRDFKRASELHDARLISQELFEDARTKEELALNSIDRAQKTLDIILDRLRKTRVMAPFDCTVLTRPVSVGQAVSGSGGFNSGTEVLTIANLNDLIISAHINQADITRLSINQEVDVTIEAIPGLKLTGKVERLAPQSTLKNNIRGFAARILLRAVQKDVRPGMTANLSIPVSSAENVVAAPLAAVFTETNPDTRQIERYVYVKKDGEWERRPVDLGVSDYFFAEITRGLAAGDEVSLEDRARDVKQPPATVPAMPRAPAPRTASTSGAPSAPSAPARARPAATGTR